MSDNEEKKRPNANYQLSNKNINEEQLVFHYNRERRLAKAPQIVRDLYKAEPPRRFSLLRPLISTKPLAMMFGSIVVTSILILVVSALGLAGNSHNLDGNRLSLQAIQYEGAVIVVVKKTLPKGVLARFSSTTTAYTGAVDIAVQPVIKAAVEQEPQAVFYHKIFFTLEPEEIYRFSVPFESGELAIVFKTEQKTIGVTLKAE
ncbi:MAG: hypothetical protein LBB89_07290 [Treponema sp.]|jgi:hypothetical protein|nr:hypothetical protein [Treponema sp.]